MNLSKIFSFSRGMELFLINVWLAAINELVVVRHELVKQAGRSSDWSRQSLTLQPQLLAARRRSRTHGVRVLRLRGREGNNDGGGVGRKYKLILMSHCKYGETRECERSDRDRGPCIQNKRGG